jgi:protein involved in polysaccharide export with SLBB domain
MLRLAPLFVLSAACASADAPAVATAVQVQQGVLGPGDVFEVRVYNEPELSGLYRVASDGTIDVPLVGRVSVDKMTASDVSLRLAEELRRFVRDPQVSLFVKEFNSQKIYVFGQVQRPGTFTYEQGMNIVQAITQAGGFAQLADKDGTYVTRLIGGREQRIRVSVEDIGQGNSPNIELQPGDIIYVPESLF